MYLLMIKWLDHFQVFKSIAADFATYKILKLINSVQDFIQTFIIFLLLIYVEYDSTSNKRSQNIEFIF